MEILAILGFVLVFGSIAAVVDIVLGVEFAASVPLWAKIAHGTVAFLGGAIFAGIFNLWQSS